MTTQRLTSLVNEYNLHRRGTPLSGWRRFQIGIQLVVPTLIHRWLTAVAEGTLPVTHQPRHVSDAWGQLLPPSSAPVSAWDLGDELPLPSSLLEDLTETQADVVGTIVAAPASGSLLALEHLYFHANLRRCHDDSSEFPRDFIAAMEEVPRTIRGSVAFLLLHLNIMDEAKTGIIAYCKTPTGVDVADDAESLQTSLLKTLQQLYFLPESLQRLSPTIRRLDLLNGLMDTVADLRKVAEEATAEKHVIDDVVTRIEMPTRSFDFLPTEKQALLAVNDALAGEGMSQKAVAEHIVTWLGFLGEWRTQHHAPYRHDKLADNLRVSLSQWRRES